MNKIYKICLFIALFIASASIVWAGFNYSSANNYFLVDSVLKIGGNYVLVGESLSGYCENSSYINQIQCEIGGSTWKDLLSKVDTAGVVSESSSFFAISNNLIFLKPNSRFVSGVRTMSSDEFSTNAITISSSTNNLEITPQSGNSSLNLQANKILLLNNLRSNKGVTLLTEADRPIGAISDNSLYVEQVIANSISTFGGGTLTIPAGTTLILNPGGTASANSITIGGTEPGNNYCKKIDLSLVYADNVFSAAADKSNYGDSWAALRGDLPNDSPCTSGGGRVSQTGQRKAHKTCCPLNYYVFDFDVQNAIYCCRVQE
jgi:urease beta subunit